MNEIKFGKSTIKYRIKRSRRRKTTQIIVTKTGVNVLTIKEKTDRQISSLMQKNAKWVFRKRLQLREQKPNKITYQNNSRLPYLGKNYPLKIKIAKKEKFHFKNNQFTVNIQNPSRTKVKKLYQEWIKKESLPIFEKFVKMYSKKLGVKMGKILVRNYKNRWGNVTTNGKIGLNQNLIRAPTDIIKYVIAHEICHLIIPNHSQKFWDTLEAVLPNFEERKDWLHRNRLLLTK